MIQQYEKQSIHFLLTAAAVCLVLGVFFLLYPVFAPVQVLAASSEPADFVWKEGIPSDEYGPMLVVEVGQKFYLGDLARVKDPDLEVGDGFQPLRGSRFKFQYSSSDSKIASLSRSAGILSTKKVGKCTLNLSYGSSSLVANLTVVAKDENGSAKQENKLLLSRIKALTSGYTGKITTSKCYTFENRRASADTLQGDLGKASISRLGFYGSRLVIPTAGALDSMLANLDIYEQTSDPFHLCQAGQKLTEAASAKGTAGDAKFTVSLKKSMSKAQLFALLAADWKQGDWRTEKLTAKKTVERAGTLIDETAGNKETGFCIRFSSGKKNLEARFVKDGVTLEEGHRYRLKDAWGKGVTFVPKAKKKGK